MGKLVGAQYFDYLPRYEAELTEHLGLAETVVEESLSCDIDKYRRLQQAESRYRPAGLYFRRLAEQALNHILGIEDDAGKKKATIYQKASDALDGGLIRMGQKALFVEIAG